MKLTAKLKKKQRFQIYFLSAVLILFLAKVSFSLSSASTSSTSPGSTSEAEYLQQLFAKNPVSLAQEDSLNNNQPTLALLPPPSSSTQPHPVRGTRDYSIEFPDLNDQQLPYAKRNGITPQQTRQQLRKQIAGKLLYVGNSPFYHVDKLRNSIPYLVPRASFLLTKIGQNFLDSLRQKHLPYAHFIVTSVTRSVDDVTQLQTSNINSAPNSCHFYGTTFDISYTRYQQLHTPYGHQLRLVRDDTLKWVLSEVLRDLRQDSLCLVKHERKQSCFHITVR